MGKRQQTRTEKMHIGVFFKNTGHHIAAWRSPSSQPDAGINLRHYIACAQTAERAGMDFLFYADSAAVREAALEPLSRSSQYTAYFEPTTLLASLATATSRIGLVATQTTSYNEPYNIARRFASLDHLSEGRAGWNVVTSGNDFEALNFGREEHYEHDERYRRAQEFVQVVKGLWDSWDDDAFLYDREAGRFFDPQKLHKLHHEGKYFKVRGPLNVPRPPQGHPVIFQAGISEPGRELAAATAEGVFSGELTIERSQAHYDDIKKRMSRYGRAPDELKILPGVTIFCGRTAAEARDKEEELASLIHPVVGREYIGTLLGLDLSDCDVEDFLPDRESKTRAKAGIANSVKALAARENLNIRQLYMRLAGSHGKLTLRGTPVEIADTMADWFHAHACDGFILQPSTMPGNLDEIAELLVPELQNRGLIRVGYEGTTLREHMGLKRPRSRWDSN
jgi:FMN-dependent oxidoreductase (nitrilotriacetate monooxygenase family)